MGNGVSLAVLMAGVLPLPPSAAVRVCRPLDVGLPAAVEPRPMSEALCSALLLSLRTEGEATAKALSQRVGCVDNSALLGLKQMELEGRVRVCGKGGGNGRALLWDVSDV